MVKLAGGTVEQGYPACWIITVALSDKFKPEIVSIADVVLAKNDVGEKLVACARHANKQKASVREHEEKIVRPIMTNQQ